MSLMRIIYKCLRHTDVLFAQTMETAKTFYNGSKIVIVFDHEPSQKRDTFHSSRNSTLSLESSLPNLTLLMNVRRVDSVDRHALNIQQLFMFTQVLEAKDLDIPDQELAKEVEALKKKAVQAWLNQKQ